MPGKRADGVKVRAVPVHEDLWRSALARAEREGRSLSEVIREALARYVREDDVTPPPPESG